MQKDSEFYESKLKNLYSSLAKENELSQHLEESKKNRVSEIEKVKEEQNPPTKNQNFQEKNLESLHLSHSEVSEDLKNSDPEIGGFLKQLNELKTVCIQQGQALVKFQETMESTKEDNEKVQNILSEFDNEKGCLSGGQVFDNLPSPVAMGSPESSMFISVIELLSDKKDPDCIQEIKLFNRKSLNLIQMLIIDSHIPALKV